MMSDPDTAYTDWIEFPNAQIRFILDTNGTPSQFLIQLEYRMERSWMTVVRFDHHPKSPNGHDITEEGLHMDVLRNGEKVRVKRDFPPVSLNRAPRYCVLYIKNNADQLL